MVGVKNPEIKKIKKLNIFQNSGKKLTNFSVPILEIAKTGTCDKKPIIINKLISKFRTSSNDQIFSNVFSP